MRFEKISGRRDYVHSRFGGQVNIIPRVSVALGHSLLNPGNIVGLFGNLTQVFGHARLGRRHIASRRLSGKKWSLVRISGKSAGKSKKTVVLVMALLFSSVAFASNKGSLLVSSQVTVNGKSLAPGEYSVTWDGTGPEVQVTFMKGKKVMATAPAHVIDLSTSAAGDSAVIKKNDDGSSSLAQIRFGGKKQALDLDGMTPQT